MAERNNTKYGRLVKSLVERIKSGELPPGSGLPGQFALAAEYQVSAITANRALDELRKLGLIERRERCRSVVCGMPRFLRKVVVVVSRRRGDPMPWLHLYLDELCRVNAANGLSTVVMQHSDPELDTHIFGDFPATGVVLAGFESAGLISRLEKHHVPHLVVGLRAVRCGFNVTENRREAGRRLTRRIRRDGARRIVFIGDFSKPNHREALEGFRQECETHADIAFSEIDTDKLTLKRLQQRLSESSPEPDAVMAMGSELPFKLLMFYKGICPGSMFGFFTESPAIMHLREFAYLAVYSQAETARMAAAMLEDIAAGRLAAPAARLAAVRIVSPCVAEH